MPPLLIACVLQGGRKSRQSERGDPGIQIFVKPQHQQQPNPRKDAAESQALGKSAQQGQAPQPSAAGGRRDLPRPPSRQSSGRLQSGALGRPHSRGAANAASGAGGPRNAGNQQGSLCRRTSDAVLPLPPVQHLLHDPLGMQQSVTSDQSAFQAGVAAGPPPVLSEAQLHGLRGTLASSDVGSMMVRSPDRLGSTGSGQLLPAQPAGSQHLGQQFAGVPEFRAAVAAEAATATSALAAQVLLASALHKSLDLTCEEKDLGGMLPNRMQSSV
jgi:hypothetical protein